MSFNENTIAVYHLIEQGFTQYCYNSISCDKNYKTNVFFDMDYDKFLSNTSKLKLAFFEITYLANPPRSENWIEIFYKLYPVVDKCFIFVGDLEPTVINRIQTLDLSKVVFFTPGKINNYSIHVAKTYFWNNYMSEVADLYLKLFPNDLNNKLNFSAHDKKNFDILLGQGKENKNLVYNLLKEKKLIDCNYVTYFQSWGNNIKLFDNLTFNDTDIEYTQGNGMVSYKGHTIHLSSVIPTEIYNFTNYTLIVETYWSNDFTFFTEKIIKPILAKRLFVVCAGQNYLSNLKKLGFKTFDIVIDESYDNEPNIEIRFFLALSQVEKLCTKSFNEIYPQIKNILDHNAAVAKSLCSSYPDNLTKEINEILDNADTIVD
jgi:hypothetical protein